MQKLFTAIFIMAMFTLNAQQPKPAAKPAPSKPAKAKPAPAAKPAAAAATEIKPAPATDIATKPTPSKVTYILIETPLGNMKAMLYNETPLHRDNFVKLAKEGFFNDLLFHRVIKGFMAQGGDPDSRGAAAGQQLGMGGPGYTVPAEILPQFYHKKGALSAARMGDQMNPQKASSGSQFYIVQGKQMNANEVAQMEAQGKNKMMQATFNTMIMKPENAALLEEFKTAQTNKDQAKLQELNNRIVPMIEAEIQKTVPAEVAEKKKKDYMTLGGTAFLDNDYTVFGEVIEGLDVIDKICAVQTAPGDRPMEDLKMKISVVE